MRKKKKAEEEEEEKKRDLVVSNWTYGHATSQQYRVSSGQLKQRRKRKTDRKKEKRRRTTTTTSTTRSNTTNQQQQQHQRQQTTQVTVLHVNHNSITITRSAPLSVSRSVDSPCSPVSGSHLATGYTSQLLRPRRVMMETMRQRHPESVVTPPPGEASQPSPIDSSACPGRLMLLTRDTTLQYLCTDCNPIINLTFLPVRVG